MLGDLRTVDLGCQFDVVVCRGVLNDMLEDGDRDAVLERFARHLPGGGQLIVDVRDRTAIAHRYAGHSSERRTVAIEGGELVFTWRGSVEPGSGLLMVDETHRLQIGDSRQVARHRFVMRCWTPSELRERLGNAGFGQIEVRPANRHGNIDRLVATARRCAPLHRFAAGRL